MKTIAMKKGDSLKNRIRKLETNQQQLANRINTLIEIAQNHQIVVNAVKDFLLNVEKLKKEESEN